MIIGDNAQTTKSIALQAGIPNAFKTVNGDEIASLPNAELMKIAEEKVLFTRMFPDAKTSRRRSLKTKR